MCFYLEDKVKCWVKTNCSKYSSNKLRSQYSLAEMVHSMWFMWRWYFNRRFCQNLVPWHLFTSRHNASCIIMYLSFLIIAHNVASLSFQGILIVPVNLQTVHVSIAKSMLNNSWFSSYDGLTFRLLNYGVWSALQTGACLYQTHWQLQFNDAHKLFYIYWSIFLMLYTWSTLEDLAHFIIKTCIYHMVHVNYVFW